MMRTGKPYIGRLFMGFSKPTHPIPGTNFAGVVACVGKDVTLFKIGDKVFGENIDTFGTHAEFVCVSQNGVVAHLPKKMNFNEAAGICDGALTSMNFLKNIGQLKKGQHVLINGASGSLGSSAVQLAKSMGAIVTGVCSSKNIEMVKSIGADYVIDYNQVNFSKTGLTYDLIYDTVGTRTFSNSKEALSPNGAYISPVLGFPLLMNVLKTSISGSKKAKFSATGMLPLEVQRELFHDLIEIINKEKYHTIIDRIYPLKDVPQAHRYVDTGHKKGDVVIAVN
jgi:NADPH:quinone reductase-like Zn-dependent oxidoreductase